MAFFGKTYTIERQEKLDELLKFIGMPEDQINDYCSHATEKIEKNGDTYIFTSITAKGKKDTKFKSGEEFDDVMDDNSPVKTTYIVDGNTITQIIKSPEGIMTSKSVYNGDELITTVTADNWDGVAKIYYKAN